MDDLIGLYLLHIQYSLRNCTLTRSCCLPYPLLDALVSYSVSKLPAYLPHMQMYLYPDLSLSSSLQTQKNVLGITKGELQFPLLLLLLGDHSVSHPSLFPVPLVSFFPDISLSHKHQIRSVAQSCPTFCDPMNRSTPGLPVHHTNSQSSLRLTSIKSVMPSSHLILCRPLLLLPPIPPSIRVFSNESTVRVRWPK